MSYLAKFKKELHGKDFLLLDTETTGLRRGEICQIAIIKSDGNILLDTFVKTKEPIPESLIPVHGITDEMVKNAPSWPELVPQVKEILDGQLLVVYNAVYDRSMMHQSGERHGLDKIEWKEIATWFCAMEAFAEYYGYWNEYHGGYRWQRLVNAASYFDVKVANAHNALGDCLMTLGVVKAMLYGTRR
jgi:DNA polymerase-3 subunit epsilon